MKNSTKSASSSKAVKVTKIRGVKGIVFFDPAYTPRYITVRAWEASGCPEDESDPQNIMPHNQFYVEITHFD